MRVISRTVSTGILGFILAVGSLGAGAPAFAADTAGIFTITANDPHRLQAAVRYQDLDLTSEAGRDALRERVRITAERLCSRIGERRISTSRVALSCENEIRFDASLMERAAIAQAARRSAPVQQAALPAAQAEQAP